MQKISSTQKRSLKRDKFFIPKKEKQKSKKLNLVFAFLLCFLGMSNLVNAQCCANCPQPLPDGAIEDFSVFITDDGGTPANECADPIGSINLVFDHQYTGDLIITLTNPSGTTVTLFDGFGANDGSYDITFSDTGGTACGTCVDGNGLGNSQTLPATALTVMPFSGTIASLNTADNCGEWIFTVEDVLASDEGVFHDFAILNSSGVPYPCSDSPPTCDISLDSASPAAESCPDANDGEIAVAASCTTCASIEYSFDGGGSYGTASSMAGLADGSYTIIIRDSADPSCSATTTVAIAAGATTTPPSATTTDMSCIDDAVPTGLTATCDACPPPPVPPSTLFDATATDVFVEVTMDITHTFFADLDVFRLIAPTGEVLVLASASPNFAANNGTQTIIFSSNSPGGSNNFSIAGSLASLDGADIAALGWSVQVYDCVGADAGTLDFAEINFTVNGVSTNFNTGTAAPATINDGACSAGTAATLVIPPAVAPDPVVEWYNASTGGALQGTGTTFDPTSTMAEEGAFDNSTAGDYTYYSQCVCDGCPSTRTAVVYTVENCCDISLDSASPTAESCPDANDGEIAVAASCTSCASIEYSFDGGGSYGTASSMAGLADGSYTIIIRDSADPSCSATTTVAIAAGATTTPPSATTTDMSCIDDAIPTGLTATCDACPPPPVPPSTLFDATATDVFVEVTMDITHTFFADLDVFRLIAPTGEVLVLASASPNFAANNGTQTIIFSSNSPGGSNNFSIAGSLASLDGADIAALGWSVQVYDCVGADAGTLDFAEINFTVNGVSTNFNTGTAAPATINDGACSAGTAATLVIPPAVAPDPVVEWYNASTGGALQGTGTTFDPTSTMAEEGAFDNSTAGDYTYYSQCVCDGCPSTRTAVVYTVENCCDISLDSASPTAESCPDANDGEIAVAASCTSCASIEYSFDGGGSYGTASSMAGLADGSYTIIIRDSADPSCSATTTVAIAAGATTTPPSATTTDMSCIDDAVPTGLTATCDACPPPPVPPSTLFDATATDVFVEVTMDITHTFFADLDVFRLIAPTGEVLVLASASPNFAANNGTQTITFSSNSPGGSNNFSIAGSLASLDGADIAALGWSVQVYDCVGADAGTLDFAEINFTVNGVSTNFNTGTAAPATINDGACSAGTAATLVIPPAVAPDPVVEWYNASTGGALQGTGTTFDPTSTMAEEGAFDNSTAGDYTYYSQCVCDGCPSTRTAVVYTVENCCDIAITSTSSTDENCFGASDGTITINATSSNGPIQYSIDNGATFQAGNTFSNVASGVHNIVVQDAGGATCQATAIENIAAGVACGFNIADPCNCLDNATAFDSDNGTGGDDGEFSEVVSITGPIGANGIGAPLPPGLIFTIVTGTTGAFDAYNIPAIGTQGAGVPVATDGSITLTYNNFTGHYEIPFVHVDDIGYTVFIEGPQAFGNPANITLDISNKCAYPNPTITEPALSLYCPDAGAVTMTGAETNGAESVTFLIDGTLATSFDPSALSIGDHTVTMIYNGIDNSDGNGGVSPDGGATAATPGCTQPVTKVVRVDDAVLPTALCQSITVQLDATGNISITAADVDNGSSDNCNIASMALSQTAFTCDNEGTNAVVLTVTDINNNVSTCNAVVTVEDNVNPDCQAQDITIQLDAAGNVSITAADVDNGSSDACGIASLAIDMDAFTCAEVGANTVTLTITDNNTNVSTCTSTVTVEDNVNPDCQAQDITIQLDATGNASITAGDVDNGSSDACGIASLAIDMDAFTCAEVGANTVTLTVTDNNTNVSTCTSTVTVEDNVNPTPTCQDITIQLDATGNTSITTTDVNNGSSDACGIASLAIDMDAFTCAEVGANTVTLTITDNNTNVSTCTSTVTVEDNVNPTPICQDITVQLDAAGNTSIVADDVDNGSNDACGIASLAIDMDAFTCAEVGANTVTLTVTDNNTNVSTCTSTVTVEDNVNPTPICQDITVQLDAAGNVSIIGADVDNGSNDACGIASLAVAPNAFTCAEVGGNPVVLTVTDNNDNVSTCNATVTVEDNVAPDCQTMDIEVFLDEEGEVSIVPADIDNNSTDACGIATYAINISDFTCADLGANTVTLTLTDVNDNSSNCDAEVTVTDAIPPTIICRQPISTCTMQGECGAYINLLNPYVDDNCADEAAVIITHDGPADNFYEPGTTILTWTATDIAGNQSTCEQEVFVYDDQAPVINSCSSDMVFDQDGDCLATVTIDVAATDNCGIASMTNTGVFSYPIGGVYYHEVVITDVNGLQNIHTIVIQTHDEVTPEATFCPEDVSVESSIELTEVDLPEPTFTDNCPIQSITNDAPELFPVGTTTVTWSAVDSYGLVGYCSYDVHVAQPLLYITHLAERIEACVEESNDRALVTWNQPDTETECEACPTTDYEDFVHIADFYGHQYFMYVGNDSLSFADAQAVAETELNAHLVTINDFRENNFLKHNLPVDAGNLWIGLMLNQDEEGEINYEWANHTELGFSNLEEITELQEGNAVVAFDANGNWTLTDALEERSFIVERPCITLTQTGPVIQVENGEGELEDVLLKSGDEWPLGEYIATYQAENMCGDILIRDFEVLVDEPRAEYCTTAGADTQVWIEKTIFHGLEFAENNNAGYMDYSESMIEISDLFLVNDEGIFIEPTGIQVELFPGGNNVDEVLYWNAWIDLNNDGDFFDEGEMVLHTSGVGVINAQLPLEFFGEEEVRSRISVSRFDYPEVCSDYFSGEVEDYSFAYNPPREEEEEDNDIRISLRDEDGTQLTLSNLSADQVKLIPNPASNFVRLHTPALADQGVINVLDASGKLMFTSVLAAETTVHRLDVSELPNGVFIIEIANDDSVIRKKLLVGK